MIINFDEHGGFADHVPTPLKNIPPPDSPFDQNGSYPEKFGFDRLGVRVPLLVVSPLVPKGLVVSAAETGHYEHCSILNTVRNLLNCTSGPLTKRDAWAPPFDWIFNLSTPRSDIPWSAPEPPSPSLHHVDESNLPINDLQQSLLDAHNQVSPLFCVLYFFSSKCEARIITASSSFAAESNSPRRCSPCHVSCFRINQKKVFLIFVYCSFYQFLFSSIRGHDTAFNLVVAPLPKPGAALETAFVVNKNSVSSMHLNVSEEIFCFVLFCSVLFCLCILYFEFIV